MISVVIPAHNESSVIARTLTALTTEAADDELEIVVVCNGCTDDTAAIAKSFGRPVRVVETELANKTHALNLGDQSARAFPRVYIDADVVISLSALRALARRLQKGDVIAVAPQPYFDLTGCSWPVRAFYDIRCRMPSFKEGIGGSGVYALSENARRRFAEFPNVVADDAYVRSQFKPSERETLSCFTSTVSAPRSLRNLIAIETRQISAIFKWRAYTLVYGRTWVVLITPRSLRFLDTAFVAASFRLYVRKDHRTSKGEAHGCER